ncbi:MAG: hypothetical protein ACK5H4_21430 [Lacrimispora sphenoides]
MRKETLHFRLGADAGKLLMEIAQEHLIYGLLEREVSAEFVFYMKRKD